ncbi:cobaltochelatase CobN subunit [Hathewaya proteolytica DSM 3090]|uniref:Cobaltochelatase CobN subunit n=1 Tax=Hathewaya proteolytica DSM 3090 TaxID=1121331 RepID=A0A1M6QM21_9CLOT|nr:cobaltochelatase subunit CobN [Hathewaya proteolytica]SHK21215.1 cobaltochelatase CobN subunit [Hathewaya proteolytica DSM 3090]
MLKIAYYTAVDTYLSVISKAYDETNKDEIQLKVWHKRNLALKRCREELDIFLKEADIFIIQLMGNEDSLPGFSDIMQELPRGLKIYLHGTTEYSMKLAAKYNTIEGKVAKMMFSYIVNSGSRNFVNMFKYLNNVFNKGNEPYENPKTLPWEGIYHPKLGTFSTLDDYLKENYDESKITIGISFYRNYWLNGDVLFVDSLVEKIEAMGCNALPVFVSTYKDQNLGNLGIAGAYKKYFIKDDKPVIDVLINVVMFANGVVGEEHKKYLDVIDVPVIQAILNTDSYKVWKKENYGLLPSALSIDVALPEFDGGIITVPIAHKETRINKYSGIPVVSYIPCVERINKIVNIAKNYAQLRSMDNSEKKVAIIMHNYPPKNEFIGCAYGLDTQQSIINILKALKDEGILVEKIYENSGELMDELLKCATGHEGWNTDEKIKNSKFVTRQQYLQWFEGVEEKVKDEMVDKWGTPLGDGMVYDDNIIIPGVVNGNVFIGIQPTRGFSMDPGAIYHSPDIPMGHHYLAYYRWIKYKFKANAVIHMGKHGSLEWLPGKAVALSEECNSDVVIDDLPNIYPYIINNPGEGTQAKRRSYACIIDHLEPAMENAGLYEELEELENKIDEYYEAKTYQSDKCEGMEKDIEELINKCALEQDLKLEEVCFQDKLQKVHGYLNEMKDTLINNGLHILGQYPEGENMVKFLVALTRLSNSDVPSLRETIAMAYGYSIDYLYENIGIIVEHNKTGGQIIEDINDRSVELVQFAMDNEDCDIRQRIFSNFVLCQEELCNIIKYIKHHLLNKICRTREEIEHLVDAINGRFIPPGPSGAPTRGQADILPTGRNFYTVNPFSIPSQFAWNTGVDLGKQLLERYRQENNGDYPENVGIVLFGSPTMRTRGEDVAEILYLIGVRPIWQQGGATVKGFHIIPLEELGRPRIDVTIRASGFFRDGFPNLMELIDEAIQEVSSMHEKEEQNYILKHMNQDIKDLMDQGTSLEEAREISSYRIFSAKPGAYGAGVNTLVDEKNWKTNSDMAKVYLEWGGYVYGKKVYGQCHKEAFKNRLSKLDLAVKNIDTKETDVIANDDNYAYLGGMVAATTEFKGKAIKGFVGDSSDPTRVKTKDIKEETKFLVRTKLLNPKWYNGLKKHGFKGATDVSRTVDYVFGWGATTGVIDDWTYNQITEKFIKDKDFSEWMKENNPWALQNIIERMLEAIQREMWHVDEETVKVLKRECLDNESLLERDL